MLEEVVEDFGADGDWELHERKWQGLLVNDGDMAFVWAFLELDLEAALARKCI
jgi:hypothetical protein